MLPFAAILAIAAIGQTLVIQQRGLDLSVAGDDHADDDHRHQVPERAEGGCPRRSAWSSWPASPRDWSAASRSRVLGHAAGRDAGRERAADRRRPADHERAATASTPAGLDSFALDKTVGIPNTVLIAVVAVVVVTAVIRTTVLGRRFVAVGASPAAAPPPASR